MNQNKGKEYEAIIESIEKLWLSKSAKVTRNAEVPDVHTGESREIDVLIEIPVGSALVKIGVECRDRSSKQDVKWIEELISKQVSCGLSKIIAVSRSGFTKPAIHKAQIYGIYLRHAGYVSTENIGRLADDVMLKVGSWQYRSENIRLILTTGGGMPNLEMIPYRIDEKDSNNTVWGIGDNGVELTGRSVIEHFMRNDDDVKRLSSQLDSETIIHKTTGYDVNGNVVVQTQMGNYPCRSLHITMWVCCKPETISMKKAFSYIKIGDGTSSELYSKSTGVLPIGNGVNIEVTKELIKKLQ